jgi:hypothetical protein
MEHDDRISPAAARLPGPAHGDPPGCGVAQGWGRRMCLPYSTRDRADDLGKRSFLPNGESLVSARFGTREDFVSCTRHDFLKFSSLSSLINMPCHLFLGGTLFNEDENYN